LPGSRWELEGPRDIRMSPIRVPLRGIIGRAAESVETIVGEGVQAAMARFNWAVFVKN
jgi:hypothetical protein